MIRQVQDDTREEAMARMLELKLSGKRSGFDASDEHGNRFELKTTTKKAVTTARDVGPEYFARLRTQYMIAARGQNTDYGFSFEDIYFLHPDDLEGWIQRYETRLSGDWDVVERAHGALKALGACLKTLERLMAIGRRGITLNNPKIPWQFIAENGTRLGKHPSLDLRELVAARPLRASGADSSTDADEPAPK
ncbi:MAG: hypothetical protein OXH59_11420 [Rhodospirillaceae bacterium]|nr:hypothetical protein [Rhodospirillaceae bacterium]